MAGLTKQEREDLDETRRCLYMAVFKVRDEEPVGAELAGTLCNALMHHSDALGDDVSAAISLWLYEGLTPPVELLFACGFAIGVLLDK